MKDSIIPSEDHNVRRVYDAKDETWYFSVVNIVQRAKEGSEVATNCHQLKMPASDGKMRTSDAAAPKTLLRLIQSVPSPKAEPIKKWLVKVGNERKMG
jgi:DNA-damage-inducible protein D